MSLCLLWMAGRAWYRPTRRLPTACVRQTCPCSSPSTRPTTAASKDAAGEFYRLGFEPVIEIAAEHGQGTGDLLDEVINRLPAQRDAVPDTDPEEIAVAIVGRPNVGKSSLFNRLLQGRTCDRQRHARDDPRQRRRAPPVA